MEGANEGRPRASVTCPGSLAHYVLSKGAGPPEMGIIALPVHQWQLLVMLNLPKFCLGLWQMLYGWASLGH